MKKKEKQQLSRKTNNREKKKTKQPIMTQLGHIKEDQRISSAESECRVV
jgi:hypothetical protein